MTNRTGPADDFALPPEALKPPRDVIGFWAKEDASILEWDALLLIDKLHTEIIDKCSKCNGEHFLNCSCYKEVQQRVRYIRSRADLRVRSLDLKIDRKVVNWLKSWKRGSSLFLFGDIGASERTANSVVLSFLDNNVEETAVCFRVAESLEFISKSFSHQQLSDDLERKFETYSLLCLSGISRSFVTDGRLLKLISLLERRYRKGLGCIFTIDGLSFDDLKGSIFSSVIPIFSVDGLFVTL